MALYRWIDEWSKFNAADNHAYPTKKQIRWIVDVRLLLFIWLHWVSNDHFLTGIKFQWWELKMSTEILAKKRLWPLYAEKIANDFNWSHLFFVLSGSIVNQCERTHQNDDYLIGNFNNSIFSQQKTTEQRCVQPAPEIELDWPIVYFICVATHKKGAFLCDVSNLLRETLPSKGSLQFFFSDWASFSMYSKIICDCDLHSKQCVNLVSVSNDNSVVCVFFFGGHGVR